jgi:hypothetical protein
MRWTEHEAKWTANGRRGDYSIYRSDKAYLTLNAVTVVGSDIQELGGFANRRVAVKFAELTELG